ncbi:MAG: transporter [Clostridiaceae bacterium]|jgi:MFS family permease|nr:transporter [Clostridiaceae bacterium]
MNFIIKKVNIILKPYRGLPKEIYIIFISRVVNATGAFVFPLLTLIFTKKLGIPKSQAGLLISIIGLIFLPSSMVGGKLTDSFGRKKIIVILDSIAAISYIIAAFIVPSKNIIPFIIIACICFGMSDPAHGAMIADLTTAENRSGAYSLSYMGFNLGFAVGPIIGGLLFENHLKLLFIGDAVTALMATSLILIFIKETIGKTHEKINIENKLEHRVDGSIFKVLLSRPILIWFALIMLGYNFVYAQWSFLYPMYVEQSFVNQGAKLYGKLGSFNGIIVITLTPVITFLLSKKSNIKKIFYGGIMYTIGFGMLGFFNSKIGFFTSVLAFTIGEIIVTISSMPFIANHTPASHRGRMNAVLPLIMGMGQILSPAIIGKTLEYTTIASCWRIIGIIMIIYTTLMYALGKHEKRDLVQVDHCEV